MVSILLAIFVGQRQETSNKVPVSDAQPRTAKVDPKANPVSPPLAEPAAVPEKISEVWIAHEAVKMNHIDPHAQATMARLQRTADQLTDKDRDLLVKIATDPQASDNQRVISLHLLVLSKHTTAEYFFKIASMSEPSTGREFRDRLVSTIAVAALEQIQNRALENPSLIHDMERLAQNSADRYVRAMAEQMIRAVTKGELIRAEVQ